MDTVKNAEFMRLMVRVQNALGLLCPIPWSRSLLPAQRALALKERTRGLCLHDLCVCNNARRLKIRLDALAAGKALGEDAPAVAPQPRYARFLGS